MTSNTATTTPTAYYRFKPWNVGRIVIWGMFALLLIVAPHLFTSSLALTMLSQIGYLIITRARGCGSASQPVPAGRPAASWKSR